MHLKAVDELLAGAGAAMLPVEARANLNPQPAPVVAPHVPSPASHEQAQTAPVAEPEVTAETDMESAAAKAARDRARQLLGDDDDDLVDALK